MGTKPQFEQSDADPRLIAALAAGVAAFLLVTPLVLLAVYSRALQSGSVALPDTLPPAPRLQSAPAIDLATLRATEDRILTTYGWIDRNAGLVRIPVERAIALTAEHGIPDWGKQQPAPTLPPRAPQP